MNRIGRPLLWLGFGMLCFAVFQIFTRIPLLNYLHSRADFTMWTMLHPLFAVTLIALSAGVFEEVGRLLFFLPLMRGPAEPALPIVFGFGHSLMEILYLFVPNWSRVLAAGTLAPAMLERLLATGLHIVFSFMVWDGLRRKRPVFFLLTAVVLHGLIDVGAGLVLLGRATLPVCYASMALCVGLGFLYIVKTVRRMRAESKGDNTP